MRPQELSEVQILALQALVNSGRLRAVPPDLKKAEPAALAAAVAASAEAPAAVAAAVAAFEALIASVIDAVALLATVNVAGVT